MQFTLEDYGKIVEVTGYRGISFQTAEAYLKANRKQNISVDLQFFDADLIASPQHLYFAALDALEAFKSKTNISKSLAMETILYASAQRQILKAIECLGIKPHTQNMALLVIGDDATQVMAATESVTKAVGAKRDDDVLKLTQDKISKIRKVFEISDQETHSATRNEDTEGAVTALVIERMALLPTQL